MSCVIWIEFVTLLSDYRQGWRNRSASSVLLGLLYDRTCVCVCVCNSTFFCGGDLSADGVDLEQVDVVLVGELADQAVDQLSVWSLWVVAVRRRHTGECNTCRESDLITHKYSLVTNSTFYICFQGFIEPRFLILLLFILF